MNKNGAGQSACYRSLADEQYYGVHDWWQTDRPERKTCSHGGFTNYETPRPNNDLPGRGGQRNRRRAVRHRDYLEIDVVHTHVDIRRDLYGRVRDLEFNIAHALSIELSARPIGSLGVDLLEPLLGSHVEVRDPPPERRNTGSLQRHLLERLEQVGVLARHIATEYLRVADAAHPRVALEDRDDVSYMLFTTCSISVLFHGVGEPENGSLPTERNTTWQRRTCLRRSISVTKLPTKLSNSTRLANGSHSA